MEATGREEEAKFPKKIQMFFESAQGPAYRGTSGQN